MVIQSDYTPYSEDFFSSSLTKLSIIWAVAVAVFLVDTLHTFGNGMAETTIVNSLSVDENVPNFLDNFTSLFNHLHNISVILILEIVNKNCTNYTQTGNIVHENNLALVLDNQKKYVNCFLNIP